MARKPIIKELVNTRLANVYGGWIYCSACGENIGYLCYVTYDNFSLSYLCRCGEQGSVQIAFGDVQAANRSNAKLIGIRNRLCCPIDKAPLLTILEKKLVSYSYKVDCVDCKTKYTEEKHDERNLTNIAHRHDCRSN